MNYFLTALVIWANIAVIYNIITGKDDRKTHRDSRAMPEDQRL